jgi:hypothetical protein
LPTWPSLRAVCRSGRTREMTMASVGVADRVESAELMRLVADGLTRHRHRAGASAAEARVTRWPAAHAADAGDAATIRATNAMLALGCYWDRTHLLSAVADQWLAVSRDGTGGVTAAASPAGLHAQLVRQRGHVPSLASLGSRGDARR